MQATVHRFEDVTGSGSVLLDDGLELPFATEVFEASGLRHVRPGQRVSVQTIDGAITRLWIVGVGPDQPIH
jgi:2-phospho-L-lactate guanylyltransferase